MPAPLRAAKGAPGVVENRQHEQRRQQMITEVVAEAVFLTQRLGKSAFDARVIEVMGRIPRHEFVPVELQAYSYINSPLPVGYGKTVSQPFIIALMTDLLEPQAGDTVLEVGAGVGYQAAILSALVKQVYSIDIIEELALQTRKRLQRLGYANIEIGVGNGYYGWSEHAPFDKIMVTAAPDLIPPPLIAQLKPGGRMVIPTGIPDRQQLMVLEKSAEGKLATREVLPVRFSELEDSADAAGAA
ncbi:MAG TPA: protein-L-isoaspartate(D-aspartate) O-methyltransferase [Burkholderiales bacterium]|nr:protein-L-isoaspartate(D-aspartate) O-methyltransferase [Burkholderiales bacterium]